MNTPQDWEKGVRDIIFQFDQLDASDTERVIEHIRSLISQKEQELRQEFRKEKEVMDYQTGYVEGRTEGYADGRESLREEMKKMVEGMRERYVVDCMNGKIKKVVPYDKACSDLLSRLEKEETPPPQIKVGGKFINKGTITIIKAEKEDKHEKD